MRLTLLLSVLCVACGGSPEAVVGDGPFVPRLGEAETYTETFTAVALLDGGAYLQLQLAVTNAGPGTAMGVCRGLFVDSEGPWTESHRVDRAGWHVERGLHVGPCALNLQGDETIFTAKLGERQLSLNIGASPKAVTPPDSELREDDDTYHAEILIPFADATAHVDGAESSARAYLDHSRGSILPAALATRWVRVRRLQSPGRLGILREPPNGPPKAWRWVEGGAPQISKAQVEAHGKGWRVTLGEETFHTGALLYRHAPVEEHGMLGALVGSLVGAPVTRTWAIPGGVLEITEI